MTTSLPPMVAFRSQPRAITGALLMCWQTGAPGAILTNPLSLTDFFNKAGDDTCVYEGGHVGGGRKFKGGSEGTWLEPCNHLEGVSHGPLPAGVSHAKRVSSGGSDLGREVGADWIRDSGGGGSAGGHGASLRKSGAKRTSLWKTGPPLASSLDSDSYLQSVPRISKGIPHLITPHYKSRPPEQAKSATPRVSNTRWLLLAACSQRLLRPAVVYHRYLCTLRPHHFATSAHFLTSPPFSACAGALGSHTAVLSLQEHLRPSRRMASLLLCSRVWTHCFRPIRGVGGGIC